TLMIGVGVSMFSSIFVTRTYLRLLIGTPLARHWEWFGVKRPVMINGVPQPPPARRLPKLLEFVRYRRVWFLLSIAIMVPGIISLLIPPALKPGIEFTSGTTFTLRFAQPPSQADIRSTLSSLGIGDARVQKTTEGDFVVRTRVLTGDVATPEVGPAPPSELDNIVNAMREKYGTVTVKEPDTVSAIASLETV